MNAQVDAVYHIINHFEGVVLDIFELFLGNQSDPILQFIKYSLSGVVAMIFHTVVFHFSAWKIFPALQDNDTAVKIFHLKVQSQSDKKRSKNSMIDNVIAFVFSNLVAYIINIYWIFIPGKYHWIIEIFLFYLVTGISISIGTVFMGLLIKRFGMKTTYAFCANLISCILINYIVRKFIIFNG